MKKLLKWLEANGACAEAVEWVRRHRTVERAIAGLGRTHASTGYLKWALVRLGLGLRVPTDDGTDDGLLYHAIYCFFQNEYADCDFSYKAAEMKKMRTVWLKKARADVRAAWKKTRVA